MFRLLGLSGVSFYSIHWLLCYFIWILHSSLCTPDFCALYNMHFRPDKIQYFVQYVLLIPALYDMYSWPLYYVLFEVQVLVLTSNTVDKEGMFATSQPILLTKVSLVSTVAWVLSSHRFFFFKPHHNYLEIRYWYLIVYNCRHKNNCSFSIHPSCSSHSTVHSDFYLWEHRTIWRTGGVIAKATIVFLVPM